MWFDSGVQQLIRYFPLLVFAIGKKEGEFLEHFWLDPAVYDSTLSFHLYQSSPVQLFQVVGDR